jgi:hypothetical protein
VLLTAVVGCPAGSTASSLEHDGKASAPKDKENNNAFLNIARMILERKKLKKDVNSELIVTIQ